MRTISILVAMLSVMSASIGCSDDDDGDARPRYSSGVTTTTTNGTSGTSGASGTSGSTTTSTTTVSTLGEDDKRQLCASLDAFVQANIDFESIAYTACLPAAIVLGGSEQGCEARLDECMSVFPEPIMIQAHVQDESICFSDLDQCNATVAQLETCVNLNVGVIWDILGWSCAGWNNSSNRQAAQDAMDSVNVCADINAACNNFAAVGPE